jgi:hypothetical protein
MEVIKFSKLQRLALVTDYAIKTAEAGEAPKDTAARALMLLSARTVRRMSAGIPAPTRNVVAFRFSKPAQLTALHVKKFGGSALTQPPWSATRFTVEPLRSPASEVYSFAVAA